ncbi:MAG: hypothetical protein IT284_02700 [Bacteroidetes bacterium]|nr:hypothetical protein [Bacteroidota bacterium]
MAKKGQSASGTSSGSETTATGTAPIREIDRTPTKMEKSSVIKFSRFGGVILALPLAAFFVIRPIMNSAHENKAERNTSATSQTTPSNSSADCNCTKISVDGVTRIEIEKIFPNGKNIRFRRDYTKYVIVTTSDGVEHTFGPGTDPVPLTLKDRLEGFNVRPATSGEHAEVEVCMCE